MPTIGDRPRRTPARRRLRPPDPRRGRGGRAAGPTEGILVDPIYTAKALAGLVAGVRGGAWDGQRIVFWHAGGLPGLFEPLD